MLPNGVDSPEWVMTRVLLSGGSGFYEEEIRVLPNGGDSFSLQREGQYRMYRQVFCMKQERHAKAPR